MKQASFILLSLISIAFADYTSFTYFQQGADWNWNDTSCLTGQQQSPIDIQVVKGTCDNSMVLDVSFIPDQYNISVDHEPNTIKLKANFSNLYATDVDGNLYGYESNQLHFHSPSEHTIGGQQFDLEMHIVHNLKSEFGTSTRNVAVLSFLFQISDQQQPLFDAISLSQTSTSASVNLSKILAPEIPSNPIYYTYQGSLTTPPCSEIVNWYVYEHIFPMTRNQYDQYAYQFKFNQTFAGGNGDNRAIQALNGRTVKQGGVTCEQQFVYFFSFFILYIFINYFIFKLL